jgi:hypothetical protein
MTLILPPKFTFAGGNLIEKIGYNVIENSERNIWIIRIVKQVIDSSHNILFLKKFNKTNVMYKMNIH